MDIPVNYFSYPDLAELSGKSLQALVVQMKKLMLDAEDPSQQKEFCERLIDIAIENNRAGLDVITGEPLKIRAFELLEKVRFAETKKVQLLSLMKSVRKSDIAEASKNGISPFDSASLRRKLINDDLITIDTYLHGQGLSTGFHGELRAPTLRRQNFKYFNNICSIEKKELQAALDECVMKLQRKGVRANYLDRVGYEYGKSELGALCKKVFETAEKNFERGLSVSGQELTPRGKITMLRKKEAKLVNGKPQARIK